MFSKLISYVVANSFIFTRVLLLIVSMGLVAAFVYKLRRDGFK